MQSLALRPTISTVSHSMGHELLSHTTVPSMSAFKPEISPKRHLPSRHAVPAAWYRAGTSKGLFFQRQNLPQEQSAWKSIILSAMGSDDGDARQLNGMGGGSSTTSKVAVVCKSFRKDVDLEYTFVQVVPDGGRLDMTGNCGNIASGVAPFALDEGIIIPPAGEDSMKIRILNTNTNKIMESSVQLDTEGHAYESGSYRMPGLKSSGSPVEVSFLEPAGSMTGRKLPTGNAEDWLHINMATQSFSVCATLIDVANPFVLVDANTLPDLWHTLGPQAPATLQMMEEIRRTAAVQMGLATDTSDAAKRRGTPKIAVIQEPSETADVKVQAFSAGRPHPSIQLTGAVCLSAALATPNTVVWRMAQYAMTGSGSDVESAGSSPRSNDSVTEIDGSREETLSERRVRIQHPSGTIEATAHSRTDHDGNIEIKSVTILRTARRLFEGNVFYQA